MVRQKVDQEVRKNILKAREMIEKIAEEDSREAVTRQRIEKILETCMGFNILKHVTPEYAVHGVGDSEYCDLAIRLDEKSQPVILVEVKRVIDKKHTVIAHLSNDLFSLFITKPFNKFFIFAVMHKNLYLGGMDYRMRRIDDLSYATDGQIKWAMEIIEKWHVGDESAR